MYYYIINSSHHNNRRHLLFLFFIIILYDFKLSPCYAQLHDTYLTHYEDPSKGLTVFDSYTYKDGTILLQLAHFNADESCIDPSLNLDIIFPDGTINPLNVPIYQIPIYNYCMLDDVFMNSILNEYIILITYFIGDDVATTSHTGMIIDWNGNWLQTIELGIGIGQINININEDSGFMWTRQVNDTTIVWSQFAPSPMNPTEIKKIGSGFITISPISIIKSFQMFTSSDGGNGFTLVTKIQKTADYYVTDPIWEVYAIFLDKDAIEITPPYLLYQTPIDWADLVLEFCRKTTDGSGYNCLMSIKNNEPAPKQPKQPKGKGKGKAAPAPKPITVTTRYRLSFLSSGSVTNIKKLLSFGNNPNRDIEKFIPLYSGEFLIVYSPDDFGRRTGFFLTQEGDYGGAWKGLDSDIYHYEYLEHNETMWGMIVENAPYFWTIVTDRLRDVNVEYNYEHRNPNILETIPNDMIMEKGLDEITIQYDKPIIFSSGNISIYQIINDGNDLLRQTYPGMSEFTSIMNDTIVTTKVFSSTFSNPKASYYTTIDDGFVNSKQYNEAIMGISKNVWFVNTSWNEPDLCLPSATILLRLNADGTNYINGLDSNGFGNFYNNLMNELSEIVPIDRSRLSDTGKFQSDPFDSNQFTILQVEISQPTKYTKPCVKDVINDLDSLIRNKKYTLISYYPLTNMLDENFGITITHFILDVAFVIYYAQQLPSFFIPSILFLVIPIGFNSILALYIILKERYTNERFSKWLMHHTKLVSMFTILSSADVAILNMISSRLANLPYFSAPVSKDAEIKIFWGSFANIFIEDVPQFIIRVMYLQRNSIVYDPIPIFSLISAGVSIIFSLIGRTFDALYYKIPFSEKKNVGHEEPTDIIEITSNKSIEIIENQLGKDDDTIEIT
ncbi:hypothetical protein RclHR1_00160006 [Rhizophagus clarus]|uniref:Uncharacterized protein n=1 Tax=Rhizophagus clarus TaxID=94130 RepID=A0A2Z6QGJ5_9GLOM|nr:hypothetical protein RclHR1_00160006 [Rhizophagus clarus]